MDDRILTLRDCLGGITFIRLGSDLMGWTRSNVFYRGLLGSMLVAILYITTAKYPCRVLVLRDSLLLLLCAIWLLLVRIARDARVKLVLLTGGQSSLLADVADFC
ncbi:hypothetical protein PC129_g20761 [Phytophthora cactorum]|uniref:Uncharacterized protein n=1 Tax=Phytophthora cactorum TaxID=29920 RepID=A0A8T1H805_9STRA|nr:hypothetical protein PC129_g20761 [Phytophthora cactorum]